MSAIDLIINIAEWIGTAAFAIAGALTAIERQLDIFGVVFIGCITSVGGGMIRDVLLGKTPPSVFSNLSILALAAVCSVLIFLVSGFVGKNFSRFSKEANHINNLFDAIGLSAFSVVGTQIAVSAGHEKEAVFVILMGMTTGVGGGMLRDILTGSTPYIFVKHVYALASLAGSTAYYLLHHTFEVPIEYATGLAGLLVFILRMLAARYHWELPKILPKT